MGLIGNVIARFSRRHRIGLALSGGGCKAFFGLGVGQTLVEAGFEPGATAGTSAGSAMAFALAVNRSDQVVRYFSSITRRNPSNFHWRALLRGRRPFPHERMYRSTIASYVDVAALQHSSNHVYVTALRLPPLLYPPNDRLRRLRLLTRMAAAVRRDMLSVSQGVYRQVLPEFARQAGLEEVIFDRSHFVSRRAIEDVILASSSVPPFVQLQKLEDECYYLDGGITRNLPVAALPDCRIVVAVYYEEWSRTQLELSGEERGRTVVYVRPDTRLPITTWDYANPSGVRTAYDMGRKAGERTARLLESLL